MQKIHSLHKLHTANRQGLGNENSSLKVVGVLGPFDTNNKIVNDVQKDKRYVYYAILNNTPKQSNISKIKWAVSYDENDSSNSYYLFSGGFIENNKIKVSISINKAKEKFRIYAYTGNLPDKNIFLEVKFGIKKEDINYPLLILQGSRKKGRNRENTDIHNDLRYNDYTENEAGLSKLKDELMTEDNPNENLINSIINKFRNNFFTKSNKELFEIFDDKIEWFSRGDLERVAKDVISKVRQNKGGAYKNSVLTNKVKNHQNSKNFVKKVKEAIIFELKKTKGNISEVAKVVTTGDDKGNWVLFNWLKKNDVKSLNFPEKFSGLGILINDMWAYEVNVLEYDTKLLNKNGYGVVKLKLLFGYYDHFGLDYPDLIKYPEYDIFYAWYTLQHFRGYKPLITTIEFEEYLTVKI